MVLIIYCLVIYAWLLEKEDVFLFKSNQANAFKNGMRKRIFTRVLKSSNPGILYNTLILHLITSQYVTFQIPHVNKEKLLFLTANY